MPSNYKGSNFINNDHQHITGDLQIINNNKLRKLFTEGPKCRENSNISRKKSKASIMEGLNNVLTHGTINMGLINLSSQNGSINSLGRSTTSKEDHCFKEMSP